MALPSLAAAKGEAVADAPPPSTDAATAVTPSEPTGSAAPAERAEGEPVVDEAEQTHAPTAGETAGPSPEAGADSARSSGDDQVSASAGTDLEAVSSADAAAATGSDGLPRRQKLTFRLGGMPRVHAGLGVAMLRHRDQGFAVFTADTWTTAMAASAGVDLYSFAERWLVSADADWSREVHRSVGLFGGFGDSRFNAHTVGLGASLRYRALDWCQPYVHAWGGFASTRAVLSIPSIDYASDSSRQYVPAFGAALGATIWGPVLGSEEGKDFDRLVSLGLRAEAGYEVTRAFDFAYDLRGAGAYPIAVHEPAAGTLRLNAPYIRVLVMLGAA